MKQEQSVESIPSYWRRNGYPLVSDSSFSILAIKSILEEKPYPIKAAVISLQNLVSHIPDDETVVKALEKLEFIAVLDSMWSETCKYADVILPVPFFFETTSATINAVSKSPIGQVSVWMKAIDPPSGVNVKSVAEIVYELTRRLWPELEDRAKKLLNPAEIWREQAKLLEIDFQQLTEVGTVAKYSYPDYSPLTDAGVLPTETGEIELVNIAALNQFADYVDKPHNLNPFPTWIPPAWMKDGELGPDEFVPVDYMHNLTAINTWARNTKLLIELVKWDDADKVFLHSDKAAKLGIKDGETVDVYNPDIAKSIKVKAKLTEVISTDVIAGIHGLNPGKHEGGDVRFTHMPKHGLNTNFVGPFQLVDGIGSAALQDFTVKVRGVTS